jgi:hypothetical protein
MAGLAVIVGEEVSVLARGVAGKVGNNSTGGGNGVGVATTGGGADSASASDIPPRTNTMERIAMNTPPPS